MTSEVTARDPAGGEAVAERGTDLMRGLTVQAAVLHPLGPGPIARRHDRPTVRRSGEGRQAAVPGYPRVTSGAISVRTYAPVP